MNDAEMALRCEPSSDEKTMATLAQVLQIIGSWIAPLIIYLIRRDSKFVSFHAMQALHWQVVVLIVWMGVMLVWFWDDFLAYLHPWRAPGAIQSAASSDVSRHRIDLADGDGNRRCQFIPGNLLWHQGWQRAEYPVIGKLARRIVGV